MSEINKNESEKLDGILGHNFSEMETDSESEVAPTVVEFNEEDYNFDKSKNKISFSQIRKLNVQLLSEQSSRYSGKRASRKNTEDSDSLSTNDSNPGEDAKDEIEPQSESIMSSDESNNDESVEEDSQLQDDNLLASLNRENEKGLSVQNQLTIWESLLEIRIHSQKMLNKANMLPSPENFATYMSQKEFCESATEVRINTETLLEKIIEMQSNLANQFSDIKKIGLSSKARGQSQFRESLHSLHNSSQVIASNFNKFRPYRNATLLKWDDRTKITTAAATNKKMIPEDFNIVRKIDNILLKRDQYIAKSQNLKRSYALSGNKEPTDAKMEISSPHIYDDTDFYHSQLRELIEFKSNTSANAYDVTKQFAELQKLRQKMKKKIDTRASKGRKIRYAVHHKLINFMAPKINTEWTEESRNELYRSLFVT